VVAQGNHSDLRRRSGSMRGWPRCNSRTPRMRFQRPRGWPGAGHAWWSRAGQRAVRGIASNGVFPP